MYHPKAGVGIREEDPSVREDGTFISYHFPDDPNAFVMPYGPQKGKRMPSYFKVFVCPDHWSKSQICMLCFFEYYRSLVVGPLVGWFVGWSETFVKKWPL